MLAYVCWSDKTIAHPTAEQRRHAVCRTADGLSPVPCRTAELLDGATVLFWHQLASEKLRGQLSALLIEVGGLGAIGDQIIARIALNEVVEDLGFLNDNLMRVEFGSDAFFFTIPEPASLGRLMLGTLALSGRRWRSE